MKIMGYHLRFRVINNKVSGADSISGSDLFLFGKINVNAIAFYYFKKKSNLLLTK